MTDSSFGGVLSIFGPLLKNATGGKEDVGRCMYGAAGLRFFSLLRMQEREEIRQRVWG